jgi:histidyl-tRNA synthetase
MHTFNYREIRTPAFEETALFARGIGETTDIVEEMYTFTDRSETSLTLKPEMTASVIRAYIQHNLGEQKPLTKVYYLSPMFRQERPQAGRLRQFHQFGAEAIGGSQAAIDAENIALAVTVYRRLGIKAFAVKINSVGDQNCRPAYRQKLQTYLLAYADKLSSESKARLTANPMRILDSKDEGDREITRNAPLMKDNLCAECAEHFAQLQSSLAAFGVEFSVDGKIVRGLDYYTRTAYEILSTDLGSQDALAGGGRYDLLAEQLGGKPTPAVGFAAGIERLLMVMEKQGAGAPPGPAPELFIAGADAKGSAWAIRTAAEMRQAGIACEIDLLGRSLKAQMKEADRQESRYVLVVGEQELQQQKASLKNMASGEAKAVDLANIVQEIAGITAGTAGLKAGRTVTRS